MRVRTSLRISAVVILMGTLSGVASAQTPNPRAGTTLLRDLQTSLADLSVQVRALRESAQASTVAVDAVTSQVDRLRAMDLLLRERDRDLEERLRREGTSADVQQRQRNNARQVGEGLARVYIAAAPLARRADD